MKAFLLLALLSTVACGRIDAAGNLRDYQEEKRIEACKASTTVLPCE